ncbi:hypothetical protein JM946_18685 [Steroidobacter sp. S1-65]|uniref:Uncharacterized protein n=1 Tax=Steroidobacter gossypii TaxID=2805490 RepID=A0ABS1X0J3_9GAMM|nr:hypothetical protein [Steroidobacter gossypii]MBM0106764.1 hypothetical protein [Steroidobacter gossypii]
MSFHRVCLLIAAVIVSLPASADRPHPGAAYNQIVETRIRPQLERLLTQLVEDGREMQLGGTPVFNGSDRFLPGKIALAFSDLITTLQPDDPRLPKALEDFRRLAKLTIDDPNDSWGIYYYLSALNALNRDGMLQRAVDPLTFAKLRVRLDWRTFVDVETFKLIEHPSNYYCVAFAIARLRHKLGWEDASGAERLFSAITAHYAKYSGPYGFSDETDGEGRYDRYSVLLAGEIAQRFLETGDAPPSQVVEWLRKSIDVMLIRLNPSGEGFEYGRSLGPYSETAIVEVLTAGAVLDLLDEEQKALAYAFASRVAQRYVDFWLDSQTGSVNLWDGGRRTDAYRGKFRILGENFSLGHQYIYTNAAWNRLGYRNKPPMQNFAEALSRLPSRTVTWFERGAYDRALLTLRDRGRIISLPLINGGAGQHMHSPYFPIPFSNGLLSGVPDGQEPLLAPRFELADGTALMPLAFFRNIEFDVKGGRTEVRYRQSEMDRMGSVGPIADDRISVRTTYSFERGTIVRTDVYTPKQRVSVDRVIMELASFSAPASTDGLVTRFANGTIRDFQVTGFDACESSAVAGDARYRVSTGSFATTVRCTRNAFTFDEPLTISWRLRYQPN